MTCQQADSRKMVPINMRVDSRKLDLIDIAVKALKVDRTSFMMRAACRMAEEVVLDRRVAQAEGSAFDAFERALEAHSRPGMAI